MPLPRILYAIFFGLFISLLSFDSGVWGTRAEHYVANQLNNQTNQSLKAEECGKFVKSLTIDACDGRKILAQSKDIYFASDPPQYFRTYELPKPTKEQMVEVRELDVDSNYTFAQIFGKLSPDFDKLCFTQDQILNFAIKYKSWLKDDGYPSLFLFKYKDHFCVAVFCGAYSDHPLHVNIASLGEAGVWCSGGPPNVIVPRP